MRFRALESFAVAAVAAASVTVGAGSAWAAPGGPVCNVPGDYSTIQAAVNETGCTTIDVAAGTYNEQVAIERPLTLNGAQHGVEAKTRSGAPGSESVISDECGPVKVNAGDVTIDGFTLEGATSASPCALNAGIWTPLGGVAGTQILDNIIQHNVEGIYLNNEAGSAAKVEGNLIRDNNNTGPGNGDGIYSESLSDATVEGNEFTGDNESSIVVIGFGTNDEGITVADNQLVGNASESIDLLAVKNSTIRGNRSVSSGASSTIDLFGEDSSIVVTGNVLAKGVRGIQVENPYGIEFGVLPNSHITAQENCIEGNSVAGLEEDSGGYTGSLEATENWWGSATGPTIAGNPGGMGDRILDQDGVVVYTPFAAFAEPAGCPAGPTAQTQPALNVKQTTAVLYGISNPHGVNTTCVFEYGTSEAYGSSVPCNGQSGPVEKNVGFIAPVSGLQAGTVYDYRVVATSALGTTYGNNVVFKTLPGIRPTVTSVSPRSGHEAGGTTVTIIGTGLDGASAVKFGSVAAAHYTINSSTWITATSPAGKGTVDVTVTTSEGTSATSAADEFTYSASGPPPTIRRIRPTKGPEWGGTLVTIQGAGLEEGAVVRFGEAEATEVKVAAGGSVITAVSPPGVGKVYVSVQTAAGRTQNSSKDRFRYLR